MPTPLATLIDEATLANPAIRAARQEAQAAEQRIAPAGALNDPMLEVGVLNLPINSFNFRQDDMTMKMIGLGQRLPYPGKRRLREEVAEQDADAIQHRYRETVNRMVRNVRVAYYDLALNATATQAHVAQQGCAGATAPDRAGEVRSRSGQPGRRPER